MKLDEGKVRTLCEYYGQVNNSDNIVKDIIGVINNAFESVERNNGYVSKLLFIPQREWYKSIEEIYMTSIKSLAKIVLCVRPYSDWNVYLSMEKSKADPNSKHGGHWDYVDRHAFFGTREQARNAKIRSVGGMEYTLFLTLNVYVYKDNGKYYMYYNVDKIFNIIKHEITHNTQRQLNKNTQTEKDANEFKKYYNNTRYAQESSNNAVSITAFVLYKLFETEVTAEMNSLTNQMKQLGANRDNYKEVFKQTDFYYQFNNSIKDYVDLLDDKTVNWNTVLEIFKDSKIIKDNDLLKTNDGNVFKRRITKHIRKLIVRARQSLHNELWGMRGNPHGQLVD